MKKSWQKITAFILILSIGLLVYVVFSHIRPMLDGPADWIGRIGLIVVLTTVSLLLRKTRALSVFSPVLLAFAIAATAMALDFYLPTSRYLCDFLGVEMDSPLGIALDKLDSSVLIIASILLLNRLTGGTLQSLFLRGGNLRKSWLTGIIAFVICVSGSLFVAQLFGAQDLTLAKAVPWIPMILIFILGNALNEEIMFRGLFLRKIEPILSRFLANLVIAIPFVLHHTGVTYTSNALMFLLFLLPLSLSWGFFIQKNDSLWGSFLFHAGTDIPVILAIFAAM